MKYITTISLMVLLLGCFTEKKAKEQQGRILGKYPWIAADAVRKVFPCVTDSTKLDSTGFKESLAAYDSLLASVGAELQGLYEENDSLRERTMWDSLFTTLDSAQKQNCQKLLSQFTQSSEENRKLRIRLSNAQRTLDSVRYSGPILQPVEKKVYIKDMAEVYYAQKQQVDAENKFASMTEKRDWWRKFAIILGILLLLSWIFIFILFKRKS